MSETDFSSSSDFESTPFTTSASVSKERWASFALGKLRDGFALLQSPSGTVYRFQKAGEPLQPCPAHAAKKLVAMGLLTPVTTDARGTRYMLRSAFKPDAASA